MKHWTIEGSVLDHRSPAVLHEAARCVVAGPACIAHSRQRQVKMLAFNDHKYDIHEYDVCVEVDPGIVLPLECDL